MRWKHLFFLAVLTSASLLLHSCIEPGYANSTQLKPSAIERGVLWRISKPGIKPSFLFGTIHLDDPRVTELPRAVEQAFTASKSFAMEVVADPNGLARMGQRMFLPPEETLRDILGSKMYDQTKQAIRAHGLNPEGLDHLKPWVVITMLSKPKPTSGVFLDLKLHLRAEGLKKPVHGLESMKEQIDVFDTLLMEDQISVLRETLATRRTMNLQIEALIQAYLERDLKKIQFLAGVLSPDADRQAHERLMDKLLDKRNIRMADRMEPLLNQGDIFVAVGILHLPGQKGVINLLKGKGFKVDPLY